MSAHRILLYGASNLWLSRRQALTELRRRFPGHLEIGLALGPGRSYGLKAGNPLMKYEPLSTIKFGFSAPVEGEKLALLTDIGNDVAYIQRPDIIIEWVRDLATRLEAEGYRIVMGGLPTKSIAQIGPQMFKILSRLYFPDYSLSPTQVIGHLEEVSYQVRELSRQAGYRHIELNQDWFTFDRFHLNRRSCRSYWETMLSDYPVCQSYRSDWSLGVRRPLFPRRFWLLGREYSGRELYSDLVPYSVTSVR